MLLDERGVTVYDDNEHVIAIMGDYAGYYGTFVETWGLGVGDDDNYMAYDVTNGFRLVAAGGVVTINGDGLAILSGDADPNRLNLVDGGTGGVLGYLGDYLNPNDAFHTTTLRRIKTRAQLAEVYGGGYVAGRFVALVESAAGDPDYLELYGSGMSWTGGLIVGTTSPSVPDGDIRATGDIMAMGDYTVFRGGTTYAVSPPVILPTAMASTSWDGDAQDDGRQWRD